MPTTPELEAREYEDAEVMALPERLRPRPFEPFPYNAPAERQGQGNGRKSLTGQRWCPYCQTPLINRTKQSCEVCFPIRNETVSNRRPLPASPAPDPAQRDRVEQALDQLLTAVDEMSRTIALASAHQHGGRTLKKNIVEEMFMSCKEVIVMADTLRRERNSIR